MTARRTTRARRPAARRGARSRGMGLTEFVLSLAVVAGVLAGLVFTSNSLRVTHADRQTRETLRALRTALVAYERRHGQWPPGPADRALQTLALDPVSAPALRPLVLGTNAAGGPIVRDGYGHEIRYVRLPHADAPDFVSGGPDGAFADATDNLYGSDMQTPTP